MQTTRSMGAIHQAETANDGLAARGRCGGRSRNWFSGKLVRKIIPGRPRREGKPGMTQEKPASWQAFLVPPTGVISNSFLEDLERIWALRDVIPDPNNFK